MNQQIDPNKLTRATGHDLNRLAAHISLHQLAWSMNTAFSGVFLLNQGLSPVAVFLSLGAIIVLRFTFRPAALFSVRRIGLRATLTLGTFLYCLQSPLLAPVHGLDTALVLYCVVGAIAQAFYWMCYHAIFAATGDIDRRGSQIGCRFIDAGHARRATWLNGFVYAGILLAEALCGDAPAAVLAVTTGATLLSGLYVPSLMTAVYNEAKSSPCPLRFHFTAEAGWDVGGLLACFAAAAFCFFGASLQAVILLALPMVAFQARLLDASYAERHAAIGWSSAEARKPVNS